MIKSGNRYIKNGWTIIVHMVKDGEIYYEKRLSEHSGKDWPQDDEKSRLGRCTIEQFEGQINGLAGRN